MCYWFDVAALLQFADYAHAQSVIMTARYSDFIISIDNRLAGLCPFDHYFSREFFAGDFELSVCFLDEPLLNRVTLSFVHSVKPGLMPYRYFGRCHIKTFAVRLEFIIYFGFVPSIRAD